MSNITNIIIAASLYGSQQMFKAQLDTYTNKLHMASFLHIDKCSVGGDNCLRADVFVAAFKDLDKNSFVDFFKSLHYSNQDQKETLQVFIKHESDSFFSVFTQDTISQLFTSP